MKPKNLNQQLIDYADFDRACRDAPRLVTRADVTLLSRRVVRYEPCDFSKIPFPVLSITLHFQEGAGEFLYVSKTPAEDPRRAQPKRR